MENMEKPSPQDQNDRVDVHRPVEHRQAAPHWYESNPERLQQELEALRRDYMDIFVARVENRCLAFVIGAGEGFIALVTPRDYPLSPPRAFDLSGRISQYRKDGSVDISFSRQTGFRWYPSKSLRDAALASEVALAIQCGR